jgi:serine phosphatase RsbU (regulator of sigma subunit)/anti-sigma regulatory factor (Ser/Thr protein kinase)
MSNRLRVLLVLIGAIGLEGLAMGLMGQTNPVSYIGVPGALGALIAVGAAILAGPLVGLATALAGGLLFIGAVSKAGLGSNIAIVVWAGAAVTAGVVADRYRRLQRERDTAHDAERAARQESERARGRLARLQAVTAALSGALSSRDAVEVVARHAVEAVGARGAAVGIIDDSGLTLEVTYAVARDAENRATHRVHVDADVTLCEAFRTGRAVNMNREEWRRRFPEGYRMLGHLGGRIATRPLVVGTERLGAISLTFIEERELEPADLELVDAVVRQVALAVRRVRSFESEHVIAATLQNSLLPPKLPKIAGVELSASYVAGAEGMDIGGDWYDAVSLPNGSVCVAVGDVCGRGLAAAAAMGQLRSAWRALATLEHMSPAAILDALDRYVDGISGGAFSTLASVRIEPATGRFDFACAGHPPPLVITPGNGASYLPGGRSMPLGVPWQGEREDQRAELPAGATLMLYTDGLIERRGEPIDRGIQRLRDTAAARSEMSGLDDLGQALARLIPAVHDDDVAMLFLRVETTPVQFLRRFSSDPQELAGLRHEMRRWLIARNVEPRWCDDLVLVCGEAASNAIEHGYLDSRGEVEVSMQIDADGVVIAHVRDHGCWRPPGSDPFRGRGLDLMRTLMDSVEVRTGEGGTTVSMSRALAARAVVE